jgi:hypothetical protein
LSEVHLSPERKSGVNVTAIAMEQKKRSMNERSGVLSESITSEAVSPSTAPTVKADTDLIVDILVFYTPQSVANNFGGR